MLCGTPPRTPCREPTFWSRPSRWREATRSAPRCSRSASSWPRCTSGSPPELSAATRTDLGADLEVDLLHNAVRPYAWGSRTAIAELLGKEVPAPHPEAELWMGAHPGDPSRVAGADGVQRSLLELLTSDPDGQLGTRVAERWGSRLPFLLKVLAAEEALSLQAH